MNRWRKMLPGNRNVIFIQINFLSLPPAESLMLGTEMDLQLMEGTVVALENSLKMWLHDHGGDREHLRLLLPPLSHNRVLHHTLPTTGQAQVITHTDTACESTKIFIRKSISCCTQLQNYVVLCFVCLLIMYGCVMLLAHVPLCSLFEVQHAGETSQPSPTDLGVKTESMQDFQPPNKSLANQNPSSQCLRVVKYSQVYSYILFYQQSCKQMSID